MLEYLIVAFSFSLSSLWFVQKKGLKAEGIHSYTILYDIVFIIIVTISFPVFLFGWLTNNKNFTKNYSKTLAEFIREEK